MQCHNLGKAEDLTQEIFMKLFKNLSEYKGKKKFKAYLYTIANHLCFAYAVVFGSKLSFQRFSFGSPDDYTSAFGNNFDGYKVIRDSQEYSLTFGEEHNDESLQQIVRDYQSMEVVGIETELEKTDWRIINSWLGALYPELRDTGNYKTMISYAPPEKLTGLYERRQKAIRDFLDNSGQVGAEKEYLLQMNSDLKEPYRYEWVEGWSVLLGDGVADIGVVMALFLAIALSSLFSGEWHDNTSSLVLTTRNGWKEMALEKIYTGLSFIIKFLRFFWLDTDFFLGTADPDDKTDCHCSYEYAAGRDF